MSVDPRKEAARQLNSLVDRALTEPGVVQIEAILNRVDSHSVHHLVDRIRRRATVLSRRHARCSGNILATRDQLVLRTYAHSLGANVTAG